MPDLICQVDGEAEDIATGTPNMETIAEDTSPALGMATGTSGMVVSFVNASNLAVQPSNCYLEFDTSGISTTPSSATLKLYVSSTVGGGVDFYVMRAFFATAGELATTDQASYTRDASGATPDIGDMVKYSAKITSVTTGEVNEISLNSTAIADMVSKDNFQIAIVSFNLADQDADPSDGVTYSVAFHTQDHSSASSRPILSYIEAFVPPTTLNIQSKLIVNGGKIIIK